VQALQVAFAAISQVNGDDGRPLVDSRGEDPRACDEWRTVLRNIEDELNIWGRTFRKAFGTRAEPDVHVAEDDDLLEENGDDELDPGGFGDDPGGEQPMPDRA